MELGETIHVVFHIPMPKSWSAKKRKTMRGMPHQQRPDIDNILKGLMDAVLPEDSHVHGVVAYKTWADTGAIEIL